MAAASHFASVFSSFKDQAKDAIWALSSCICKSTAKVKINGRTFQIIRVLGEGGFSFVYLAQDEHSGRQFALKKIRCPTGSEGVKEAMREVEAYRRFKHPNIIRILDSAVVQDPDGEGKVVYLFLPLYQRGNLQDAINANVVNGTHFPEQQMVRWFKGACEAVRAMHTHRAPIKRVANANGQASSSQRSPPRMPQHSDDEDEDDEDEDDEGPNAQAERGAHVPLVAKRTKVRETEVVFEGDEELDSGGELELVPYAHRDIKPGNVMIADDGAPILMDFGSTIKARITVQTRSQALLQQDIAAEQSTMTYRAPELFDVKTGVDLDEKVDIWSLGCTLYALAYSRSPFETTQTTEQGGSIAMAVMNAQYKHPPSAYSQGLKDLIDIMLKVNPKDRPDIHQVIKTADRVLQTLT